VVSGPEGCVVGGRVVGGRRVVCVVGGSVASVPGTVVSVGAVVPVPPVPGLVRGGASEEPVVLLLLDDVVGSTAYLLTKS
jgi:hypothetical protein